MDIKGYWLASGILGVTGSILHRVAISGADAVVTKSIGLHSRKGHPGPIIAASHGGLLNAVGLTNPGIDAFIEEMTVLKEADIPIVLSIFGETIEEAVEVARKGKDLKPSAIELNLSCPHAKIGQISHNPELTFEFVRAVKNAAKCQIFAKITPNASDYVSVAEAVERAGADAVVAINTIRAMKIDIYQKCPVLGNKIGGLSGPPIFPIAVRCVYDIHNAISIPIIGVGGVSNWQDAIEMHLAGASAIQIGTALLKGLDVFREIKEGIELYLEEEGFSSISEIIGMAGEIRL